VDCPALPELFGPLVKALKLLVTVATAGAAAAAADGDAATSSSSKKSKMQKKGKGGKAAAAAAASSSSSSSGGGGGAATPVLSLPAPLLARVQSTVGVVQAAVDDAVAARLPLRLQSFQAQALESLAPRFEENYSYRKVRGARV
jgi:hypothetical protein